MISCDQHDYIEIVCTFKYPIKLTLLSGTIIEGIAKDTQLNDLREECIKVTLDRLDQLTVLDTIALLEVCIENPHFKRLDLSKP